MNIQDAQTIAQAKIAEPESLWHFLLALPSTFEAQLWYALLLGGVLGMLGHYINGRRSGDIAGSPIDYFFRDNVWRSVGAVSAMAAELFAEIGTGLFTTEAGLFVGWGLVIVSGIKSGYVGDSLINKGKRVEWTTEKREAVAVVKEAVDVPTTKDKP